MSIVGATGITTTVVADSVSINLDDTAVTPGVYGDSGNIPRITVDQQGRLTAVSTVPISVSGASLFTLAATSGTSQSIAGGDTLMIAAGTGITATAGTPDTVTVAIDSSVLTTSTTLFSLTGDSGSQSIISGDNVFIEGGTGLTSAVVASTLTMDLDDTAVVPTNYGAKDTVATFTVDQQGRLTAAADVSIEIASTAVSGVIFSIQGDAVGADSISRGENVTFSGGSNINTTTGANDISIDLDTAIEIKGLRVEETASTTKYVEILHNGTNGTISTAGAGGGGDLIFDAAGDDYTFNLSGALTMSIGDNATDIQISSSANIQIVPGTNFLTKNIIPIADSTYNLGSTSFQWARLLVDEITIYSGNIVPNTTFTTSTNDIGSAAKTFNQGVFHAYIARGDSVSETGVFRAYNVGNTNNADFYYDDDIRITCGSGNFVFGSTASPNNEYDLVPISDNTMSNGTASFRWSDVRSVLINGADYGFHNGWILREYPATFDDVQKYDEDWFRKNANQGIQVINDIGEVVMLIKRDGTIYGKEFRNINELNLQKHEPRKSSKEREIDKLNKKLSDNKITKEYYDEYIARMS